MLGYRKGWGTFHSLWKFTWQRHNNLFMSPTLLRSIFPTEIKQLKWRSICPISHFHKQDFIWYNYIWITNGRVSVHYNFFERVKMKSSDKSPERPNDPNTRSTTIFQEFTDVPGGADINDPEVINRPRTGRPDIKYHHPEDEKNNPQEG